MKTILDYKPKVKSDLSDLFNPFFENKISLKSLLNSDEIKNGLDSILEKTSLSGPSYFFVAELPEIKFHYFSENTPNIIGHTPKDIISSNGDLFFKSFVGDYSLMNDISAEVFKSFHELEFKDRKEYSMNLYYNAKHAISKRSFSVVQRNFPISFDSNGCFKGYIGIVTDISSYTQLKQPKATITSNTGEILKEITSNIREENRLSDREIEVIKLISLNLSNEQIGEKLNISFHTVKTHRKNILRKTNFSSFEDVISYHRSLIEKNN